MLIGGHIRRLLGSDCRRRSGRRRLICRIVVFVLAPICIADDMLDDATEDDWEITMLRDVAKSSAVRNKGEHRHHSSQTDGADAKFSP